MAELDFTLRSELTRNLTPTEADDNFSDIETALNSVDSTGVALTLNKGGNSYNMAAANAGTTYTVVAGSGAMDWAISLINTTSEPVVTGATKTGDVAWVTGTAMYLVVWNNGNRNEFFFLTI